MLPITRPTLLLHRSTCKANIKKMVKKAEKQQVGLIPHFKTHQSAAVGEWFKEVGVKAITVTSVKMASYFAGHGWKDITIAFPANVLEFDLINALAENVDLKIFLNSKEAAMILKEEVKFPLKYYIQIDVGDHRSGMDPENISGISEIHEITKGTKIKFHGFYTHAGHTYNAASPKEVEEISRSFQQKLITLKEHFRKEFPDLKLSVGDTPSCSIMDDFEGIDSIHPGNFVYYDLVQNSIGANTIGEIAICLAVPVVSVHPERLEVIVHSGWIHQGKDSLKEEAGNIHFGLVVHLTEDKWSIPIPGAQVIKLSQEHGVVSLPQNVLEQVKVGDILGILPVHACATAVMMGEVWTPEGEKLEMML